MSVQATSNWYNLFGRRLICLSPFVSNTNYFLIMRMDWSKRVIGSSSATARADKKLRANRTNNKQLKRNSIYNTTI